MKREGSPYVTLLQKRKWRPGPNALWRLNADDTFPLDRTCHLPGNPQRPQLKEESRAPRNLSQDASKRNR